MTNTSDLEQFFATLQQFFKLMSQHTQESAVERAATILQASALDFIIENPNAIVSDLIAPLHISKSSATQLVERLVKAGFVERVHDTEDRRIVRLCITESGKKEATLLKQKLMEKMQKIFSKLPAEDLRELTRIHTYLNEVMKKEQNG